MCMRRKRDLPKPIRPNLTPMVDLTFLMLVFFVSTMSFRTLEGTFDGALPKDRAAANEFFCGDRLDLVLLVEDPGILVPSDSSRSSKRMDYKGRRIRIEIGTQVFHLDHDAIQDPRDPIPKLSAYLKSWDDLDEIPCSIFPREGTTYGDVLAVFDLMSRSGVEKITFGASYEKDS